MKKKYIFILLALIGATIVYLLMQKKEIPFQYLTYNNYIEVMEIAKDSAKLNEYFEKRGFNFNFTDEAKNGTGFTFMFDPTSEEYVSCSIFTYHDQIENTTRVIETSSNAERLNYFKNAAISDGYRLLDSASGEKLNIYADAPKGTISLSVYEKEGYNLILSKQKSYTPDSTDYVVAFLKK